MHDFTEIGKNGSLSLNELIEEMDRPIRFKLYPEYKNMTELLKEGKIGRFVLEKFTIEKKPAIMLKWNMSPEEYIDMEAGEYIRLVYKNESGIGGTTLMSNTPMEMRTNYEFVQKANGDVLIAGFGLGLVVMAIQDKPEVKSITVVEKSKEVLELVANQLQLNDKVRLIVADIFEWEPPAGKKYDTVYFDIWPFISSVFWKEHKALRKKFKYCVNRDNPNHWISSWRRKDFQRLALEIRR